LGKQDNCQVAVSLSVATHQVSLPVAYQLYLPKDWADDPVRRTVAGIADDITFQTKPAIALQQLRQALADGVPPAVVLADPAYGTTEVFELGSLNSGCLTRSVSSPPRRFGGPARRRFRRRLVPVAAGLPSGCAATRRIGRSRSRRWH
jgi:hypothetical protein